MSEHYELKGHERVEKIHEKVPCGHCITTKYFHPESGEELRVDVEIQVAELAMQGIANL